MKKFFILISLIMIFGGALLWLYISNLQASGKEAESNAMRLRSELWDLKKQKYKIAEYDSVYSRIDRMVVKGYVPDTLVLWCIRRAWTEAGLSDSTGLSWVEIESGVGQYDHNLVGEKGVFFLSEKTLRDVILKMGGDTVGFQFKDYQSPYMQSKWAAFYEWAIRIRFGRGAYWAYNMTNAFTITKHEFDKLMDEFAKWRARNYMNAAKKKKEIKK